MEIEGSSPVSEEVYGDLTSKEDQELSRWQEKRKIAIRSCNAAWISF